MSIDFDINEYNDEELYQLVNWIWRRMRVKKKFMRSSQYAYSENIYKSGSAKLCLSILHCSSK